MNEERSQAIARIVIPATSSSIIAILAWQDNLSIVSAYNFAAPIVLFYGFFGVAWLALIARFPTPSPLRRLIVIVTDLAIISWAMAQVGETGVIFYPLYLWIIVGNGMRFGANYLIYAIVVGQFGFASLYLSSEYWGANFTLGLSLQSGMIVLPLFYLTLMRRLHSLNERLAEEAERSRAAANSKAQFLANMSHELRTPMNGVVGVTQILADTTLGQQQRDLLELIHRSADSLLSILNDILDYSKVDAGKLILEETAFDLRCCVNDIVQLLNHKAEEKRLTISCHYPADSPDCFIGDRTRIRQILVNLIGNAIKFTDHGEVSVTCAITPSAEGLSAIEIGVHDTGIGIASENLERIFVQFEQADSSTSRNFGGTGLGLAISRQLAEAMEGGLTVTSQQNKGSSFCLRVALANTSRSNVVKDERRDIERCYDVTALVAEDNEVNQIVAQGLLSKLGIQVEIAENGKVAVEKTIENDYDLIFMDMQMPELGGKEATKIIRGMSGGKANIPIIALSANVAAQTIANETKQGDAEDQYGFNAFIGKPFSLHDIVTVVDKMLPNSH